VKIKFPAAKEAPVKSVLRTLALAVTAAVSVGVLAVPASAAPLPAAASSAGASAVHTSGHVDYLALGDSVPFGFDPLLAVGGPATRYVGYPQLAATRLRLNLTNLSCPGETSGGFLSLTAPDNGCRPFRAVAPLHASYAGTQLDAATAFLDSHPRTGLVTVMIGANDLFLCEGATVDACASPAELGATLTAVSGHLKQILDTIRKHYTGRLLLVTYYSDDYTNRADTTAIKALDGVLVAQAAAHRAGVANGFAAIAAASAVTGGRPCAAHLLIALPTGGCDVHPSPTGAAVLARAVVRAAEG
jgi:lysophospholipase L1-like esterase